MESKAPRFHERYEQLAMLGRGGAGSVHLVRDRVTGEQFALKRLLRTDTQSVLRLKSEFRLLAGLHHPNLVKLYELDHDDISAFFTMEYLEGEELKRHFESRIANDNADADAAHIRHVLDVFEQLACGVSALHRAGVLHRDLKPGNVMVLRDGRVVVLDFGIALSFGANATTITVERLGSGTPAYMAPEQVQGQHLGEPNDWYAFGVMLYEALSGLLPFEGSMLQLLHRKTTEDPTSIATLVPNLPKEVSELCMALLRRAPEERPNGNEIMNVLRPYATRTTTETALPSLFSQLPASVVSNESKLSMFGRDAELSALRAAFERVQDNAFVVVHVSGESGSGKSLLLQHFTDEIESDGFFLSDQQPLVLRSRCYERETLPFKALDSAMDALVHHLMRESDVVVGHALPRNLVALAQLFPALLRLPAAQRLLESTPTQTGLQQTRALAETALRELLERLARQRPIVLWIDDLQWGDLDSIGIVGSWLQPPLMPHVMLILSYRSEETETSQCLTMLRSRGAADNVETTVQVRALGDEHVRALCEQRFQLAHIPPAAQTRLVERIVVEAQGSPFLAAQLAALAVSQPSWDEAKLSALTLQELVRSRSSTLSPEARRILHVLSVAGRPISLQLAAAAAKIQRKGRTALHELQGLHLIRTRDSGGARLIEMYHDRLRELVHAMMSEPERNAVDRGLFEVLQTAGSSDVDWLHALALALGDRKAALRYGLQAADRAEGVLAFERAAELYERCLTLRDDPAADGGEMFHKLGLAYARAGHGSKAAAAFSSAAEHAPPERAVVCERAAASNLLCSGRFDEGEALLQQVMRRLNMHAPRSRLGLYLSIGMEQLYLWLRGLSYRAQAPSGRELQRFYRGEVYGLVAMETAAYDPLRAALFQMRCLRIALACAGSEGVARALCAAAAMYCVSGTERARLRAEQLLQRAEAIASTLKSAVLQINIASARAICAFLSGRIADSVELSYQAERLHRTSTVETEYHHRFTIINARIGALLELREFRRADAELQALLQEAAATENLNAELHTSMALSWTDTNAGRIDGARERLDRQREQLPKRGFGMLHAMHMIAVLRIGAANGDYDWALTSTREHWQAFQRSVITRSPGFSMYAYEAHARVLLHRALRDGRGEDAPREVAKDLKQLSRSARPAARAESMRIRVRLSLLRGDRAEALRWLERSCATYQESLAHDQAARERYAIGVLRGDAAMRHDALERMRELGIVDPARNLQAFYPELM